MRAKVLMILGGVGLGNATRAHAVLEQLRQQDVAVDVAASGRALDYFHGVASGAEQVFALPAVSYGGGAAGGLNLWRLPGSALRFLAGGLRAFFRLRRILQGAPYDAIVIDSNYNLACWLSPRPLISLNNSDRIFAHRRLLRGRGVATYLHFWLVEAFDYAFQLLIPDLVLSPWPVMEKRRGKFRAIGLIVRETAPPNTPAPTSIVVMGSGSGLGRIDLSGMTSSAVVYKFGLPEAAPTYDTLPALARARAVVINGGFSALSEALVHGKRILALPLAHHAEQNIVCAFLRAQGWLELSHGHGVGPAVDRMLAQPNPLAGVRIDGNGAHQAATAILLKAGVPVRQANSHPYRDAAKAHRATLVPDRPQALDAR